ncbi:MAG: hypothetical protein WCF77_04895 [Minisyncoccia bacterium]
MDHKKRFWIWTAVVVVLIALATCLLLWRASVSKKASVPNAPNTVVGVISPAQLPAGFPANIPIESGAVVVSNFNAATQNGQFQATRSFKSFEGASQNVSLYAIFLANPANGWTVISSSTDVSGGKTMVAKNSGGLLTIQVSELPPQPVPASLVAITYTTNPPRQ